MSTNVRLTVAVTESSSAEFDVVVFIDEGKFCAKIGILELSASADSMKQALQELVKLIQNKGPQQLAKGVRVGS